MVERTVSLGMAGNEISAIKETLYAQQELLQKLHHELDVEREASATAASEALSMILRLQGEKAGLEMEASQYKRMAEEKMCHAETSLAFFEDLIYQKEMEIASLEFQVQAYRCKLLSLGCTDPAVTENKFPEYLMLQITDVFLSEASNGNNNKIRRLQSLPAFQFDDVTNERSPGHESDFVPADKVVIDESLDHKKGMENSPPSPGDLNSYWEQIKRIDERVREISDSRDCSKDDKYGMLRRESISRALVSQVSNSILESTKSHINSILEKMKNSERSMMKEGFTDSPSSSSNVQDKFEVPQTKEDMKSSLDEENTKIKEGEELGKDETESLKTVLSKTNYLDRKLSKPQRDLSIKKEGRPRSKFGITDHQAELQQMKERIERLEGESSGGMRNEIREEGKGEELNLLKEIREQLNLIQSEMRSWRLTRKQPQSQDDLTLLSIKEALIYFWL